MVISHDVTPKEHRAPNSKEPVPPRWATAELGLTLIAFGLVMWVAGARFTVDGARIGLNLLLSWLGVPTQIAPLRWETLLFLIALVGWVCSRVEVKNFPVRRVGGKLLFIGAAGLIGWGLTSATDLGTTVLGVLNPGPRPWPIVQWVAVTPWATALVSVVLTFLPEWMIVAGWWMLRGRRRT